MDADRITAEFENGVLTVVVPRQAEAKPRRIEIKSSLFKRLLGRGQKRSAERAEEVAQGAA